MKDIVYYGMTLVVFLAGIWFVDVCERLRRQK